jgi:hypothetical protein
MKKQKKSVIAFAVFAASAIIAVGAPLAQSTFASQTNICTLNPSTGAVTNDSHGAATDCHLTNEVQVNVGEVLTIEVAEDNVTLDPVVGQTKGENNQIADGDSGETNVTVSTNWAGGANLVVSMNSASTNNLVNGSNNITPTAGGASLEAGQWGYYVNKSGAATPTTTWKAMPLSGTPDLVFNGNSAGAGAGMNAPGSTSWVFTYGTKIDYTTPSGAYTGEILYTATTNSIVTD